MIQDIQNFNRMIAGMNFTNKEMVKFLALYQAIKTIDNMSEEENNNNEEEKEDEVEQPVVMLPIASNMSKKKKSASNSSYGSFRKLGTRK